MRDFVVGLTNDDPTVTPPVFKQYRYQYRYIQYDGALAPTATASIYFTMSFHRYVLIQKQQGMICLADVQVYVRGSMCSVFVFTLSC